jgi:hypothetical protein
MGVRRTHQERHTIGRGAGSGRTLDIEILVGEAQQQRHLGLLEEGHQEVGAVAAHADGRLELPELLSDLQASERPSSSAPATNAHTRVAAGRRCKRIGAYLVLLDLLLAGDSLQALDLVEVEVLVLDQMLLQEPHRCRRHRHNTH